MAAPKQAARVAPPSLDEISSAISCSLTLQALERLADLLIKDSARAEVEVFVPHLLAYAEALEELAVLTPLEAELLAIARRVRGKVPHHG